MTAESQQHLITAILPADVDTLALAAALHEHFGITAVFRHSGRGIGRTTRRVRRAPLIPERRSLFSVEVAAERVEEVFAWLIESARIRRMGGGFIYQQRLRSSLLDT
ncbi:MAG: hypothetical protein EA417_03880 [Gammaproteobacteria bacterium]|nr:MAG: hypothetical protein EA417_03880 [Gammaproteobacteria bacterium]